MIYNVFFKTHKLNSKKLEYLIDIKLFLIRLI